MKSSFAILACASCVAYAHADDLHVVACRPTVTCTAELAAPGTLEVELGYELGRTQSAPILVKLPVAPWFELQVGDDLVEPDTATAGVKLHVLDQAELRPSLAITATIAVHEGVAVAQASKDLGAYHVDCNAGLAAGRGVVQPFGALAVSRALTERWSATLEPHYFAYAEPLAPRDGGAIAVVAFAAKPWLVIDGAVDGTVIGPHALAALAGISIAPVRLWGAH